jgi:uncharacterized protein (DUF433 family)
VGNEERYNGTIDVRGAARGAIRIMALESYFTVLSDDDIRLQGTRIVIETILYAYIHQKQTAEAIAQTFPQLTLEQIYATILYYLQNRAKIDQYLTDWLNYCAEAEHAQDENPPAIVLKLRELKAASLVGANG